MMARYPAAQLGRVQEAEWWGLVRGHANTVWRPALRVHSAIHAVARHLTHGIVCLHQSARLAAKWP